MTKCVICGYKVKKMSDPLKTKQDTLSITIHDKTVCGMCVADIKNNWE